MSAIRKASSCTGYHVGDVLCSRIEAICRGGHGLGNRFMVVRLTNGDDYTITQLDRDYFEVRGPHFNGRVEGWNDGLRLINSI